MSGGGGHLSNLCRVCLKPPKSTEELDTMIIYDEEEELTYYDCLKIITHMDLAEGCGTPEKLCKICGLELQMAYDFYKKVEHAKRQVMQYMDSHRNSNPEDARVQSRLKAAVIPSKPICDDLPSTSDYLTDEHRTDDFEIDCEVLDEQHLDLDDYEAIEEEGTGEYGFKLADTISGAQYCDAAPQYTEDDVLSEGGQQQPVPAYVEPQAALAEEDRIERTYSEGDSVKPPESPGHLEDEDYQDPGYSETPLHFKEEDFTEPSFAEMPALFKDEHHTHPQYSAMPAQLKGEDRAEPSCSAAPAQLEVEVHSEPPEFVPHYEPHPGGGPANVACDVCQKVFPNRSKMMWHRRMHDENRIRYRCPVSGCDKLYASKQSCNFHYKQAHLDQGVMCPICHKLFAIRQTLEVHLRYHTKNFPYECELCQKKFGQKGHLTTHMQVKHYNLRYMCSEKGCGKAFKNSMSLRNHRFVHTEMPFRCAFCDRGYPQKSKLKVHIIVKHNMELSMADLETMRRFKETRTRHSFVKLDASADA